MNQSLGIVPHIPFLRRFSRILTGSQHNGDAYVAVLLESIITDPTPYQNVADIRVALYENFCKLWESIPLNHAIPGFPVASGFATGMTSAAFSSKALEAYLLKSIEGFSEEQVARILGLTVSEVRELIAEASKATSTQQPINVLIIEDEPLIAMDIEDILTSLGHSITGIARTAQNALELAKAKRPDLIMADIQLADGSSGIEAVERILRLDSAPVIYITAFPERLLTGERPEPVFLITKPYLPDMLKAVVGQALHFKVWPRVAA